MSKLLKSIQTQDQELHEIDPKNSSYISKLNKEGAPTLFYRRDEVVDLDGHEVKFYDNGVLLVLKDYAKYFSSEKYPDIKIESQSYVFYNNEEIEDMTKKEPVFKLHNLIKNKETKKPIPPVTNIEIKVFKHFLYVKQTNTETNSISEFAVNVLTGEKIFELNEENQISMEF